MSIRVSGGIARLIGWLAVLGSVGYFASDLTSSGREKFVRVEVLDGAQAGPVQFAARTDEPNGRGLAIVDALTRA